MFWNFKPPTNVQKIKRKLCDQRIKNIRNGSMYFNSTLFHNNIIYERVYIDERDVILFWKAQMLYYNLIRLNYGEKRSKS